MQAPISHVLRSKTAARANYDRLSRWYDLIAGGSERRFRNLGLHKLAARPGERILEIGPGTGHGLLALARAVGGAGQVYGLDLSAGMLQVSRTRLQGAGLAHRVNLLLGDAAHLPFASHAFDTILMSFTLELLDTPEIPVVLAHCQTVLRSGGRLCVIALAKKAHDNLLVWLCEWAHARFPAVVDCRPIAVQQTLRDAGFRILDVTGLSMWGPPVEIVLAQNV